MIALANPRANTRAIGTPIYRGGGVTLPRTGFFKEHEVTVIKKCRACSEIYTSLAIRRELIIDEVRAFSEDPSEPKNAPSIFVR